MAKTSESKEIADLRTEANKHVIAESDLASINSLDDLLVLMDSTGGVDSVDDYGTGFEILKDKNRLIDNPFAIAEWRFSPSKQYGGEFVSALVVTKAGEKLILNDGGTGICDQLRTITDRRISAGRRNPQTGLLVSRGLRRSDYTYEDEKGAQIEASTYYLA